MSYSQNILDEKVSYLDNAWGTIKDELTISDVLQRIKEGKYSSIISILRNYLKNDEKEKYSNNKKRLPCVCFCGTFDEFRRKENLKDYTYLVVIDIDKLSGGEMQRLKSCFVADDFIYSFWESPSGNGLKGLVALKFEFDLSKFNVHECHKAAFLKLKEYFEKQHGVELDQSGSDTTRLCFFSSDTELHLKTKIKYFSIAEGDLGKHKVKKVIKQKSIKKGSGNDVKGVDYLMNSFGKNKPKDRYRIQSIIKYLSKRGKSITSDYDDWYRVAFVIANSFTHDIGEKYFLKLCKLDGSKYDEQDCRDMLKYCYANTKGELKFKTIYHFAKLQGYKSKGDDSSEDGENQEVSDGAVSISCNEDLVAKAT